MKRADWNLLTISFWFGDFLGDLGNGVLVLALVAIAGTHRIGRIRPSSGKNRRRKHPLSTSVTRRLRRVLPSWGRVS